MSNPQFTYVDKKRRNFELLVDESSERYDDEGPKELESFGVAPDITVHRLELKTTMGIPYGHGEWSVKPPPLPKKLKSLKPMRDAFTDSSKVSGHARIKSIHVDARTFGIEKYHVKPKIREFSGTAKIPIRVHTQLHALGNRSEIINPVLPPSLTKELSVSKALSPASKPMRDPLTSRTQVQAIPKDFEIFQALLDGRWVYCDDIGFFPRRLKEWLRHCRVRLLRWEGGVSAVTPTGTPLNAYVTEDGVTFYVAEDGSTFYVQEV